MIGHFQRIALNDYLTGLGIPIPSYKGYNSSVNPSIDTFFSTVSYRYAGGLGDNDTYAVQSCLHHCACTVKMPGYQVLDSQ